ncbi:class V aminotransferase [bacterium K02(2017)]|nr:class V aminotransferase [bacterium K02(2017)]
MYKYRLMAPGPTPIPAEVANIMANPIRHHRTPGFEEVVKEVKVGLKWLYQTQNEVILFSSSGSGAMEASLVNVSSPGDRVLVINGGKFGERFGKIAKAHQLEADIIDVTWGHGVSPSVIQEKLEQNEYRAVCVQASETSSAVEHPIKEIADIVKKYDQTVLIVDAITALGVINLPVDEWQIDFMIGGSQKALMLPPGLATISVSEKAWGLIDKATCPRFYFDLLAEKKAIQKNTTAWTPAVSLVVGLKEVLKIMQDEGLPQMLERHAKMASSIRNAAQAIGLKLLSPEAPSTAVTAIYSPEGIDSGKIVAGLRNHFNMTIANGQDDYKGKIFRIGHLGYYDMLDMATVWSAVEKQLSELGYQFELGKGVAEIIKNL